jgi:sugar transferase (PEP-CTERM system associated)
MGGVFVPAARLRKLFCLLVDLGLLAGTLLLAVVIRFYYSPDPLDYENLYLKLVALAATVVLCMYYNDLFADQAPRGTMDLLFRVGSSYVVAGVLLSMLYYVLPDLILGRGIFLIHLPLSFIGLFLWRYGYYWALKLEPLTENVLILGTGETAVETAREVLSHPHEGYKILGFLSEDPAEVGGELINPSIIGTYEDLPELTRQLRVGLVVVALEDRRGKLPVSDLLRCRLDGVRVEEAASFYEALTGQIPVRSLRPSWLIFSQGFSKPRFFSSVKRVLEFGVALAGLALSLPLLLLSGLAIWIESGGPVLFRQERVGEKGRRFILYKLRTMRQDAEEGTGPVWAAANGDPRVTWVGRWLRKSRIDELPQLFNVLKGEMSFVGPRPERPCFVERLQSIIPYFSERHSVKPGITGWAQVKYGYGSTVEEAEVKLRYDLYYIKHMSFFVDLLILADTAKVMLFGRGAR